MSADSTLSFVFTEESFRVDKPDEDAGAFNGLRDDFIKNRYRALFKLGFKAHERNESPSLRFLHTLAETYVADLTAQPDLEVAREWTKVELSDESYDKLMRAVPFGIGTEYINRASGGFRSDSGAQDYLDVMSYLSTGRKHNVNVFEALTAAFAGNADIVLQPGF